MILSFCIAAIATLQINQPNIVVFLVDDLGWQDTSVPFWTKETEFNKRYHTPNWERLATQGTKYTNAYSAGPVCTPSRTSLLTGQSPARSKITYWTLYKDRDNSKKHPRLSPPNWDLDALQPTDLTLPKLLKSAGYQTIHVGKAHLGACDSPGGDPKTLGFDINVAGHGAGAPGSFYGKHRFKATRSETDFSKNQVWDVPGLEQYHDKDIFLSEALATEACDAIDNAVAAEKPFFLHFATYAVHTPIMPNQKYIDRYKTIDRREAAYATLIESADAALGMVLDKLDSLEISKNTNWGVILLFAGIISLGFQMKNTGAAMWIGNLIINQASPLIIEAPILPYIINIILTTLFSNIMSSSGTVAVLAPITLNMGGETIFMGMTTAIASAFGYFSAVKLTLVILAVSKRKRSRQPRP